MDDSDTDEPRRVQRRSSRLRLRIAARTLTHVGQDRVILCDLSAGGARIFARAEWAPGRELLLRWGSHEAFGTVVWSRDGFYGLNFDEPVPAPVLLATRTMQDTQGLGRDDLTHWMTDTSWAFGKALD